MSDYMINDNFIRIWYLLNQLISKPIDIDNKVLSIEKIDTDCNQFLRLIRFRIHTLSFDFLLFFGSYFSTLI